jgi:fructose-bisphosphate aldolase class I
LAADESTGTIGKRFDAIKLENNEDNRRAYRELLFTSGAGEKIASVLLMTQCKKKKKKKKEKRILSKSVMSTRCIAIAELSHYISGVIMYEETLYQKTADGKPFPQLLKEQGIVTGIKTDKGTVDIAGTKGETNTQGLTDLHVRSKKYYEAGARFAKWRNVIKIDAANGCPSELAVQDCAYTLARYASISQANGLVPIVEPEILMDGAHSIAHCAAVTERVLAAVFKALADHHILLEGCLLKPNMVTSGADSGAKDTPADVGMFTVRSLARTVPPALPGVMFLSGGQGEAEASRNLNAINRQPKAKTWHLSFSYGRALQASTIATWKGKAENVAEAQKVFLARAKANSLAQKGQYSGEGDEKNDTTLYERAYVY